MLESLYYSSTGSFYIYFSKELIALSISLKDIVSIELFDNIEDYNKLCNQISLNLTKNIVYLFLESTPVHIFT